MLADTVSNAIERYRTIQNVDRREQHLRNVVERMTDAIVEVDSAWRFTLVNLQAEDLYEMDEEYLLGRGFWAVSSEALDTRFETEYRTGMATGDPTSFVEHDPHLHGWFDIETYRTSTGGIALYVTKVPNPHTPAPQDRPVPTDSM